jgi:hypothetical protein
MLDQEIHARCSFNCVRHMLTKMLDQQLTGLIFSFNKLFYSYKHGAIETKVKLKYIKKVANFVDNLPKIVVATVQISNYFLSDLRLIADLDL